MKTISRLDRLSALLEGLAPRVELALTEFGENPAPAIGALAQHFLYLYLVTKGEVSFAFPRTPPFTMTISAPAMLICRSDQPHSIAAISTDTVNHLISAKAFMDGPVASWLLDEFAQPVSVSLSEADASLSHAIDLISSELLTPRCGQPALLDRAGDILFIGLLRHLIAHPRTSSGLFSGLADPRIARALVAMHRLPQDNWTLERLAAEAGMSRTSFANTFREIMQQPPGKYLGRLRLSIALRSVQSGNGLKRAAKESGYASPSALSRALSRAATSSRHPASHATIDSAAVDA